MTTLNIRNELMKQCTFNKDLEGETRLVLAVILQALEDNDEAFIRSKYLDAWSNLIGLNGDYIREKVWPRYR